MQPLSVIEYLNVVEQGGFRLFPGFKVAAMDAFCLERVEEALNGGVVPAVSLASGDGIVLKRRQNMYVATDGKISHGYRAISIDEGKKITNRPAQFNNCSKTWLALVPVDI